MLVFDVAAVVAVVVAIAMAVAIAIAIALAIAVAIIHRTYSYKCIAEVVAFYSVIVLRDQGCS